MYAELFEGWRFSEGSVGLDLLELRGVVAALKAKADALADDLLQPNPWCKIADTNPKADQHPDTFSSASSRSTTGTSAIPANSKRYATPLRVH